jgi:hypothetical protein
VFGSITAFDAKTGALRWKAIGDGLYASPIVVDVGGIRQVVSVLQESIIGVAVEDGRLLWRYPWKALGGSTTPLMNGDTIVLSGLDMGVTAITPTVHQGTWSVEERWKTSAVSLYLSNAVVVDGVIFGLSHRAGGQFFALDAATGRVLWLGAPREATNTAVVKANRLLFLLNDDAELIVARASRSGIFRLVDGARNQPELEELFVTYQPLAAENTARDFGMKYIYCNKKEDLSAKMEDLLQPSEHAVLLEIEFSNNMREIYQELKASLKAQL